MTVAWQYRDSLSLAYVLWPTGALKHGDDGGKENHKRSTTKQQGLKQEYKHRVSDWELRTRLNNAAQKHIFTRWTMWAVSKKIRFCWFNCEKCIERTKIWDQKHWISFTYLQLYHQQMFMIPTHLFIKIIIFKPTYNWETGLYSL